MSGSLLKCLLFIFKAEAEADDDDEEKETDMTELKLRKQARGVCAPKTLTRVTLPRPTTLSRRRRRRNQHRQVKIGEPATVENERPSLKDAMSETVEGVAATVVDRHIVVATVGQGRLHDGHAAATDESLGRGPSRHTCLSWRSGKRQGGEKNGNYSSSKFLWYLVVNSTVLSSQFCS